MMYFAFLLNLCKEGDALKDHECGSAVILEMKAHFAAGFILSAPSSAPVHKSDRFENLWPEDHG